MGSIPYRMCNICCQKKLGVYVLGLVDKISPAFELRNSGVSAVARSFQLPSTAWILNEQARVFVGFVGGERNTRSTEQELLEPVLVLAELRRPARKYKTELRRLAFPRA
jgi:hypothetical protein